MRSGNEKVFVYGTLKPGYNFGDLYLSQWKHSEATINGSLHMVNCGTYAGLNLNGQSVVHGFVYEVDERMLNQLDRVEGCPTFYKRSKTETLGDNPQDVWVYEYADHDEFALENMIEHGVFEYVKGLYENVPLLQKQNSRNCAEFVRVMIGGRALRIENPQGLGFNNDSRMYKEHPCPKIKVSIEGGIAIKCLFLNPHSFYDLEEEGIDLMFPSGEIVTGIPYGDVRMVHE